MIDQITVTGDITTVTDGIVCHCCNDCGIMGAGVALSIKRRWPTAFIVYRKAYEDNNNSLNLGDVHYGWAPNGRSGIVIANIVGQHSYGVMEGTVYVNYDALRKGFKDIADFAARSAPVPMIHYPKLGAYRAGGDWTIIQQIINEELGDLPRTLWLYEE